MTRFKKLFIAAVIVAALGGIMVMSASAGDLAYGAATVDATALNIRKGPSTEYACEGMVAGGARLVILDTGDGTWYKINYHGTVGYVRSDYLRDVLTAENFDAIGTITADDVRIRTMPSTAGDILTKVSSGTEVNVIGINSGWYKITYQDITGYVRSDLLEITGGKDEYLPISLGQQIADYALNYLGYNYVYGAESPSDGFDCSGLVYYVYGQYGYKLSRSASQQYKNNGTAVSKSDLQPGDLVFFSSNGSSVTHVGIYIGDSQFVHASTSTTGVIISDLTSAYYTRVWFGARRIV